MDQTVPTDKQTINKCVVKWAEKTFGPTFEFRPKQKESIIDIIWSWFHQYDNIMLDAPTGSGKSIIAMVVAGVLSDYYKMKGYILISDLSLLQQYENDVEKYLPKWGVIKGQQAYTCIVNGFNFTLGACSLKGISPYSSSDLKEFADCAPYCEYVIARQKAEQSIVTVCTYSFWLIQQNMLRYENSTPAFSKRDFVICDEAHKLLDIVQSHYSPKMSLEDEQKINLIFDNLAFKNVKFLEDIKSTRKEIYSEDDNEKLAKLLETYAGQLKRLSCDASSITKSASDCSISDKREREKKKMKTNFKLISACTWLMDVSQRFTDYVDIISKINKEYMIKNYDIKSGKITFNCLNESYLMISKFHKKCGKRLYMSATIGDPDTFKKDIAANDMKPIKLPIVFDYKQSPIFFINEYKMSYAEKDMSFPHIASMVANILNLYPGMRGIIQTGSYAFAQKLHDLLPDSQKRRLILYSDSTAKQDSLDAYKYSSDKVLVGPTLIEGISLDDDLCRFQIIMKVPYPSLADKFIAAKRNFNPQWYSNLAATSILQGVGRGVRNEKDWCITFILDACFNTLYNMSRKMFPVEFIERIQQIPSSSLKL